MVLCEPTARRPGLTQASLHELCSSEDVKAGPALTRHCASTSSSAKGVITVPVRGCYRDASNVSYYYVHGQVHERGSKLGPQQKGEEGLFDVGWVTGIMEEAFNG